MRPVRLHEEPSLIPTLGPSNTAPILSSSKLRTIACKPVSNSISSPLCTFDKPYIRAIPSPTCSTVPNSSS